MLKNNRQIHWGTLIVLVIGILLRFLFLDADPHYYSWNGYITDEGRWNESARNMFYYSSIFIYRSSGVLHLVIAPLFQFTNYLFYLLFDLNHLTSRMFPAICGSSILILFYLRLRSTITPHALLLGITLLASQADLVMLSRVSIPETAIMFFQILIFFFIIATKYTPYNMVIAGFLMLIGVGMKITTLPIMVIFSVIILLIPPISVETKSITRKFKELGLFWSSFLLPGFVLATVLYLHFQSSMPSLNIFHNGVSTLFSKLKISTVYGFISFPFDSILCTTFNIWSLGLWITVLTWTSIKNNEINNQCKRILLSSTIWFVLSFILMQVLRYYPERYKIQILIPMAILITVGINLFQQTGVTKIVDSFTKGKPVFNIFRACMLTVPTSVFLSPLLIFLLGQFLSSPDRLLYKITCIILLTIVFTTLVFIIRYNKKIIYFFLIFPIVSGVCWQLLWAFSAGKYHFWTNSKSLFHPTVWTFTLLITLIASVVLVCIIYIYKQSPTMLKRAITFMSIFCLVISFVRISPCYLNPQYTIKNTSKNLGTLLSGVSGASSVACEGVSSLFIGNSIPYRHGYYGKHGGLPEYRVGYESSDYATSDIIRKYRPIKRYKLYISPEYIRYITEKKSFSLYNSDKILDEIIVYKRIEN